MMLPVSMLLGIVLYKWMGYVAFLSPYLIFLMLFITYCKLDFRDFKPHRFHLMLFAVQMALAALAYFLCLPADSTVAEGVFICVFIPTATAAPVVTAMLGGNISFVATYSLLCNGFVALAGPVILAMIGENPDMTLLQSTLLICRKVLPLLILPLLSALLLRYIAPGVHKKIVGHQQLSFYLWCVSLLIVVGSCVSFIIRTWQNDKILTVCLLAVGALVACLIQYVIGRRIGRINHDAVSGAQSLMQKNTVLAVWMAMTYLNPLSSVAPAAYIAWQNILNSWQIMRHSRSVRQV